jgi:putative heme degradation protein
MWRPDHDFHWESWVGLDPLRPHQENRTVKRWFNIREPELVPHRMKKRHSQAGLGGELTMYGIVTSVKPYGLKGRVVALFGGVRQCDSREERSWKKLVEELLSY